MQENILLYLESIRTPFIASLFEILTITAEAAFTLMVTTIVLWGINKKKGAILFITMIVACLIGLTLKSIVRYPRPFTVIEGINSLRVHTATGYSFPSGHTLNAAVLWTSLAMLFKKKWLNIVAPIIILLAGLSRLILGVHWPTDVLGGLVVGVVTPLILIPRLEKKESLRAVELRVGSFSLAYGLLSLIAVLTGLGSHIAFDDIIKLAVMGGAAIIGLVLEEKNVGYKATGSFSSLVLRCAVGNLLLLLITVTIKKFLGTSIAVSALRYGLCGFWVAYLYPLIGSHFGLFIIPPASTQPSES